MESTQNAKFIKASPERIYEALTDPAALVVWQVPGDMTGKVYQFDLREGGSYMMSVFYPESEPMVNGKTAFKEDRFTARFVQLSKPTKIIEAIRFDSDDPAFVGEMIMEITLEGSDEGTLVTFRFTDIPPGIDPHDNETGTISSLEKLAKYVGG